MLAVVPGDEAFDPGTSLRDCGERAARVLGPVLEGPEERPGVWIIVADARTAEGRDDAEALERGEHRGALHRSAVVRVQHQTTGADPLAATGIIDEAGGDVHRLFRVQRPADALAAIDVNDEVQEVERAAHRAAQVGDVPAPDLVGLLGHELARPVGACRPGPISELPHRGGLPAHDRGALVPSGILLARLHAPGRGRRRGIDALRDRGAHPLGARGGAGAALRGDAFAGGARPLEGIICGRTSRWRCRKWTGRP